MTDVARILSQIESGDPSAAEQLLPLVYDELRKLAAAKLAHFTDAMLHPCDGEQDEAIRSFEQSIDTFALTFLEHELAVVFLEKLKSDQHWPDVLQK